MTKPDPNYVQFAHLSDTQAFDDRFMSMIQQMQYEKAYEIVEAEYSSFYGINKYSNFDSFYRSWRKRQKRKIEMTQ